MNNTTRHHRQRRGFSLVEVTLALGVAAFALLAICAVLPVGIGAHQSAMQQTTAMNIATSIVADLRETPASAARQGESARYKINADADGETTFWLDVSGGTVSPSAAWFKARVTLVRPAAATDRAATQGTVTISWPALAEKPAGTATAFIALDRN